MPGGAFCKEAAEDDADDDGCGAEDADADVVEEEGRMVTIAEVVDDDGADVDTE